MLPIQRHRVIHFALFAPHTRASMNFLDVPVLTARHGRFKKLSCPNAAALLFGLERIPITSFAFSQYWPGVFHARKNLHSCVNAYGDISYVPNAKDKPTFSASF